MKSVKVVIGSLWGDEAKGHMTQILTHNSSDNTIVVRFNGGCQASHTVECSDGKRHAFKHHASGIFSKAATYLSNHFIVNLTQFIFESDELTKLLGFMPTVYVNPKSIVSTIYDEMINQEIENNRGDKRHGSCGFGINETVMRCKTDYRITVADLFSEETLRKKFEKIRTEYVPMRLKNEYGLSIDDLSDSFKKVLQDNMQTEYFLFFAKCFLQRVGVYSNQILYTYDTVIFEGAQGLLLDQNNKEMAPHLTTSNTGTKNVMEILDSLCYSGPIEIFYMCRVYMTRHGAGPFPHELSDIPYEKFEDKNNVPNRFQGLLRFSYMDYDVLSQAINKDLPNLPSAAKVNVVFSCIDQLSTSYKFYNDGILSTVSAQEVLAISEKILKEKMNMLDNVYGIDGISSISLVSSVQIQEKTCA
jgi:adenylosuccinate synthase